MVDIREAISAVACMGYLLILACRRFQTAGGTKFETSPPSVAISLIMRELRKEYSSLAMRKIVSRLGAHAPVEQGHLEFDFIIGDGADAAQNHAGLAMVGIVDQQPCEGIHFHVGERGGRLLQHFDSFGDRKQRLFLGVFENGYDELTDQARAARNEIEVSVSQRIE